MAELAALSTASTITKTAFGCGKTLYDYFKGAAVADKSIESLKNEVKHVRENARSVETVLESNGLQIFQDAALWERANDSLEACGETLKRFEAQLKGVRAPKQTGLSLNALVAQFKLTMNDEDIERIRQEMQTHNTALQMLLITINIHVTSLGSEIVVGRIEPQIALLTHLVEDMKLKLEALHSTGRSRTQTSQSSERLQYMARSTIHRASSVVQDEISSIVFDDHSQDSDDQQSQVVSRIHKAESPKDFKLDGVVGWLLADNVKREEARSSSSEASTQQAAHTVKIQRPRFDEHVSNTGRPVSIAYSLDATEEWELRMLTKYVKLGAKAAENGDFAKAEGFYRSACAKNYLLPKLSEPQKEGEVEYCLAISLLNQDKSEEALQICKSILKQRRTEHDRLFILSVSLTLAECYLMEGDLSNAWHDGLRSVAALHRLLNIIPSAEKAYYRAIAFMSKVCELRDDPAGAAGYADDLPPYYQIPDFKHQAVVERVKGTAIQESRGAGIRRVNVPVTTKVEVVEAREAEDTRSSMQYDQTRQAGNMSSEASSLKAPAPDEALSHYGRPKPEDVAEEVGEGRRRASPRWYDWEGSLTMLQPPQEEYFEPLAAAHGGKYPGYWSAKYFRDTQLSSFDHRLWQWLWLEEINAKTVKKLMSKSKFYWAAASGDLRVFYKTGSKAVYAWELRDHKWKGPHHPRRDEDLALHIAAAFGEADVVRLLCEAVPHTVDHCDTLGRTALDIAVTMRRPEVVRTLLSAHAYASCKQLDSAIMSGMEETVRLLLEHGVPATEPNWGPDGNLPLHIAAQCSSCKVAAIVLTAGADIDARQQRKQSHNMSALHLAVRCGNLEMIKFLINAKACIDVKDFVDRTPLHLAAGLNNLEAVEYLAQAGANLNARNVNGCTPLHYAALFDAQPVISFLCGNGADINVKDRLYQSALYKSIAKEAASIDTVKSLLGCGCDANSRTHEQAVLTVAVQHSNAGVVSALLGAGADVNATDRTGWTALHHAAKSVLRMQYKANDSLEVLMLLLENGALPNVRTQDKAQTTPLHMLTLEPGARREQISVCAKAIEVLLNHGAHVSVVDAARWNNAIGAVRLIPNSIGSSPE